MPAIATADLAGQVVREVVARGKHLLLRTDAGVTLHSHLKMEGAWHLYRPAERWRGPGWQVRAVLRTERWVAVGFRLGVCELLPTAREHEVVGHLGTALLDQRALAGVGNIWKCELCFLRGVDPWTPVGQLDDLEGMLDLLARMMEANRSSGTPVRKADQESLGADRVTYWCPKCQPGPGPDRIAHQAGER